MAPITNLRRASSESDDQPPKQQTTQVDNPRREALLALASYVTMVAHLKVSTYAGSPDMRILGQLWDEYGEDTRQVILQAYAQKDSLASERFPKFTLHTVAFYAKFKYVPKPQIDLDLIIRSNTEHGIVDESNLAKALIVRGLRGDALQGRVPDATQQRVSDKVAYFLARSGSKPASEVSREHTP